MVDSMGVFLELYRFSIGSFNNVRFKSASHAICLVTRVGFGLHILMVFVYICTLMLALSNDIETNPGPIKSCPVCNSNVPIRKSVCECGHIFKKQKPSPMKLNETSRVAIAKKRLSETESEAMVRKESNKVGMAKERLSETESEAMHG